MKKFDLHIYDDIINLPHHVSQKHKPMKMSDRAVQFGSFAALTGHSDAIAETGRLTSKKHEITEYVMQILDSKLQVIKDNLDALPQIKVTYFKPDDLKEGGAYVDYTGNIRRIDDVAKVLVFEDGTELQIDAIYSIDSDTLDFPDEFDYL